MSLEAKDIVSGYGSLDILHGVSISAPADQITCVIGPNGSGKSTLMKTIMGLLRVRKGTILYNREEIVGLRPDEILRKGVAFVPQGRTVFPNMTVLENLEMGAYILSDKNEVKRRLEEVFVLFPQLRERQKQLAITQSGGEQRMVDLGRAMMLRPKIIILDEPSLGLSPKIAATTYENVKKLKETGMGILMVEQNVRAALNLADYLYVLDLGRNVFEGTGQELLSDDRIADLYIGKDIRR